jgi:membrane-associated protein
MIDFLLHIDVYLTYLIDNYHYFTYLILFLVVFLETGIVATPFLPGDSLLFAIGALAATSNVLSINIIGPLLFAAALLGDNLNYTLGKRFGIKLFEIRFLSKILKKKHLESTELFYKKHGGKTIILARFIPIIRTFTPFIAGIGKMPYKNFIYYSVLGAFFWISTLTLGGFFLGNIPAVKRNFDLLILSIILISNAPLIWAFYQKITNKKIKSSNSDLAG